MKQHNLKNSIYLFYISFLSKILIKIYIKNIWISELIYAKINATIKIMQKYKIYIFYFYWIKKKTWNDYYISVYILLHCSAIFRKLMPFFSPCIKASDTLIHLEGSAHLLREGSRDIKIFDESKGSHTARSQQMLSRSWELHVSLRCNIR